ncbi:MAG: type-F conjugative transfer system secretin TraK [Sulfurimonas sp.]|jgi:hypothetical protein
MKKIRNSIFAAIIILGAVEAHAEDENSIQVIEGSGGYKFATVSLKDMSRIHCADTLGNVFYSKEKEIEIKTAGSDAYIKIQPRKVSGDQGEKIEYGTHPREMYIECSGQTFSLVLVPKDIPAQTIILKVPFTDVKKATQYEKANPYDSTMLDLVKKAFVGDVPDGYEPIHVGKELKNFEELSLVHVRSYIGSKYTVNEYLIDAKRQVTVYEAMFIPFLKNPLAISIVKPILEPTESTRMFVVSLNQNTEENNAR